MNRSTFPWWLGVILTSSVLTGCVDRRFVITTEVPGLSEVDAGAIAYDEKGQPVGATPVDRQWTYNGNYKITLVKDGYQTLVVEEQVKPRWYEYFPLDFIAENLMPFTIRDVRRFHYQLQPAQNVPPEAVLDQAQVMRIKGQGIGVPLPPGPSGWPGLPPPPQPLPPDSTSGFSPTPAPLMPPAVDLPPLPPGSGLPVPPPSPTRPPVPDPNPAFPAFPTPPPTAPLPGLPAPLPLPPGL